MKVSEAMTPGVRVASPQASLTDAARLMAELDAGALPVGENDRLVGMVTDRDIVVRGLARGLTPDSPVREVMTEGVKSCFDDQEVEEVLRNMGEEQVRRLPVVNRDKRLVGILSLGDLAVMGANEAQEGQVLSGISRPGGTHSQTG